MFESRRSRMVGKLEGPERRRVAASSAGVLMSKSLQLSGDVYNAMLSRGFRGEVYVLDDFQTSKIDWIMLAVFVVLASGALYFGW
jgi:energy-coupling factor transporter transmembrane protein EcfT